MEKHALTREHVCATALRLIDERGLDALSMRPLAAELNVTAMALYRYFPNKAMLLDAVLDTVMSEMTPGTTEESGWEEYASAQAWAFRRTMQAHPNVLPLFAARPATNAVSVRAYENTLTVLARAGFDRSTVVRGYFALFNYTLGFVTTEISRLQMGKSAQGEYPYRPLPKDEYPLISAITPHLEMLNDEQFEFGLSMVVKGLRSLLT